MFAYSCACQAEVAVSVESKLQSQNCTSYWTLEVSTRVPRLESIYVSICKLQPLYFVIGRFWRSTHCEGWKLLCFCEVPKFFFDSQIVFDRS